MASAEDDYDYADPPACVDTGDQNAVKQALDDVLLKGIEHMGYSEDMRQQNLKLKIMVFASVVASMAQFKDKLDKNWEFPKNMTLLYVGCSLYFIASGILQYMIMYMERDVIGFFGAKEDGGGGGGGMAVHTTFGRFTDQYEVTLVTRDNSGRCLSKEYSVGEFFDLDGNLDEMEFVQAVRKLVNRFAAGDTDKKGNPNTQADLYGSGDKQKQS